MSYYLVYEILLGIILIYVAYKDLRFYELKSLKLPIFLFALSGVVSLFHFGFGIEFIMAFVIPFAFMYFTQLHCSLKSKKEGIDNFVLFGSVDILLMPVCTSVFGCGVLLFILVVFLEMTLLKIKPIKQWFRSFYKGTKGYDKNYIPFVPIMVVPYLIFIVYTLCNLQ